MRHYREVLSRIRGGGSEGYVGRSVQGGTGNHRFCGLYQEDGETLFTFTSAEEVELPGEIYLEVSGSKKPGEIVRPGTQVEMKVASS